jgi:LruC domain-containing protein
MQINGNTLFTNNNILDVLSDIEINNTSTLINNCRLMVRRNLVNNNSVKNYAYMRVFAETIVNTAAEISMYDVSMLTTLDILLNGTVKGYGQTSLVKVIANTKINTGGQVIEALQFCDVNGLEANTGTIGQGAVQSCNVYVPISSCNLEGNGLPIGIVDTDADGVPNSHDAYPADATKAFNNYYPSASGVASVSFEDTWPSTGDYDLNDVVMTYRYNIITNATNNVVQVIGNYTLQASGGAFQNGFGIEFPTEREKISNLVGGTLEAGQTKAVVTLFNNSRNEMNTWNTIPSGAISDTINYNFSFNVTTGPPLALFGLNEYNPFIWNNTAGFGRGYEVHLPGKKPTDLVNTTLFGKGNDNTNVNAGRYYLSKSNYLPWALSMPNKFNYPIEKADINTAYLKFATWVQSGGTVFEDWYKDAPGYRDAQKVYVLP